MNQAVTQPVKASGGLGTFERYLSVWVALCMVTPTSLHKPGREFPNRLSRTSSCDVYASELLVHKPPFLKRETIPFSSAPSLKS